MRIISNKNIYFSERKERQCPPFSHSEWIKFAIFALIVRPKKKKLQMSKHITEEQRYAISMMLQIPRVESITDERLESNCSIIEKIPPKGESFSDFIATFAMSVGFDTYFDLQH